MQRTQKFANIGCRRPGKDALLGEPVPEIKWRIGGLTKKIEKFQDHQDSGLCQIQGETEKSAICDKAMARLRELAPVGQRVPRAIFSQPSLHLLTLGCTELRKSLCKSC